MKTHRHIKTCSSPSFNPTRSSPAGKRPGQQHILLHLREKKPQGLTEELHQQALYSSPGPEHWALWWSPGTWLQMDTTSEAGWQQPWSPHLNKPHHHLQRSTSNGTVGLFENLRAWELRGLSAVEGYRTFCTNRPLRCCRRWLFSFAGWRDETEPCAGGGARWGEHGEKHTKKMIECIYTGASNIGVGRETHLLKPGKYWEQDWKCSKEKAGLWFLHS